MDPNLHGAERGAGEAEDFDDSLLMQTYGERGAEWQEETYVPLVQNLTGFPREATGETWGRSRMAHQVKEEQQAHDLYAYLAGLISSEGGGERIWHWRGRGRGYLGVRPEFGRKRAQR